MSANQSAATRKSARLRRIRDRLSRNERQCESMEGDPLEIVGDLIDGQFRVDAFVGIGDLSIVYRGFHVGVDAAVAIKFLELPTTLDPALVEPLIRSFRDGSKLHYRLARGHMNIAQSIASGQTLAPRTGVNVPYLVREWLDGTSLARDFADRRLRGLKGRSIVETRDLFAGAVEGLAYAHRQGIAHLGLNPSNLFVARTEGETRLKILDFGVAHAMNEHGAPARAQRSGAQATGLRILSPAYAAPEQLDAAIGRPGPATDVYAMALMWLEALDDAPVFPEAPPTLDRALRPEARAIGMPRSLDPRVATVLERALAFVPRDRYPSAGILWKELSEVLPKDGASAMRKPSGALKIPVRPRSQTLLGLNVPGPEIPAGPASTPAKRNSAPPPSKRNSAPPLPPAASRAPKPPPPRAPEPVRTEVDDAPTRQEPQLRIATPVAEPLYVEKIAQARESAALRAAQPIAPAPAPGAQAAPPIAAVMPPIPPAPPIPRALGVPPPPMMAMPVMPAPAPFARIDASRSGDTIVPFAPRRKGAIAVVLAVVAAAFVLVIVAAIRSRSETRSATIPSASAATVASSKSSAVTATPIAPATTATATSTAAATTTPIATATARPETTASIPPAIPTAATSSTKPKHRFFVRSGRAALDEAGASLADCKRPHGKSGSGEVRVTFFPKTGRVVHVLIGPPFAGTDQGRCIVGKFRQAQVDPFLGPPSAINYVFRMPR